MPHFSRLSRELGPGWERFLDVFVDDVDVDEVDVDLDVDVDDVDVVPEDFKLSIHCHPDRSEAQRAQWRDLLFAEPISESEAESNGKPPLAHVVPNKIGIVRRTLL